MTIFVKCPKCGQLLNKNGKCPNCSDELFPLKRYKIYYDRTKELEMIKQKLFANKMSRKKDNNSWVKNVEFIFTKEELEQFVQQKKLEKIKVDNRYHYIVKGTERFFNKDDFKEG